MDRLQKLLEGNCFRNRLLFAVYRCLIPMLSIISIFCHDLLLILFFLLSTWPLTFNLWHLFKEVNKDAVWFHQEILIVKYKNKPFGSSAHQENCSWGAFHFSPRLLTVMLAKWYLPLTRNMGLLYFVISLSYFIKTVGFIPIRCTSFQHIGQTWEPILCQVCVRIVFA